MKKLLILFLSCFAFQPSQAFPDACPAMTGFATVGALMASGWAAFILGSFTSEPTQASRLRLAATLLGGVALATYLTFHFSNNLCKSHGYDYWRFGIE